jgi:hypothetical protein
MESAIRGTDRDKVLDIQLRPAIRVCGLDLIMGVHGCGLRKENE